MIPRTIRLLQLVVLAAALSAAFAVPAGAATPQVSPSYYHSCALEASGTVKCFGYNDSGQAAGGASAASYVSPTTIDVGGKAISVGAGYDHSCAVLESGAVKCWGANGYGQLGNGTDTDSPTPVTVSLGTKAVSLAATTYSTCAIVQGGDVACWGYGGYGQLGNGSSSDQWVPVYANLSGHRAVSIATGYDKTCAVVEDGGVWCWGDNQYNDISSLPDDDILTPTQVNFGAPAQSVAADYEHLCALLVGGAVKCVGANYDGQLGDGTTDSSTTPVTVNLGEPAVKVAAAWYHSCAQLQSGTVKCWGDNEYGQISPDTGTANYLTPFVYDAGGPIGEIFANAGVTCAALTTGELKCSGYYVPYYMNPSASDDNQYAPLLIAGVNLTPLPPAPKTIAGTIAKPKWKLKRSKSKVTASATLTVSASGMDATHCVGDLQVSVPALASDGGTGKKSTAPTFALKFANGACTATAKRTIPLRVAKKGARLKVYLKSAPLLTASAVTSTTKLPKK